MPTTIVLLLGFATLLTAIVAAYYWYRASAVSPDRYEEPLASVTDEPAQYIFVATASIEAIRDTLNRSGRLNKLAAIWTGASALLSGITTFAGIFH